MAKEKAAHPVRGERLDVNGCYVRWYPKITLFGKTMNIKEFLTLLYTEAKISGYDSNTGNVWCLAYQRNVSAPGIPMDQLTEEQRLYVYATTFLSFLSIGNKKNTPRDFIVKTQEYEREFWLSDNINSQKAILPDKNMWRNFKDIYFYISTDYDTGNDGVPFADLLPEERINAAAYYVEEHLEDWTTLLSFTVPYARYTNVPNAK